MLPGIASDRARTSASPRAVDWYQLGPSWVPTALGGSAPGWPGAAAQNRRGQQGCCLGTSRGTAGARRGARAPPANILLKNSSHPEDLAAAENIVGDLAEKLEP